MGWLISRLQESRYAGGHTLQGNAGTLHTRLHATAAARAEEQQNIAHFSLKAAATYPHALSIFPPLQAILESLLLERGELSLEHLRHLPGDEVKAQLVKYKGVGPKSIACEELVHGIRGGC